MKRSNETAKPSIVRVKRRRQDPAPLDLIIEAPRQAAQGADPADCFATLAVSTNHTHKRRKFQLVTTVSHKHLETEDLLQALQSGRATDKIDNSEAGNLSRASAGYRQVPPSNAESDPVQQSYKIYDLELNGDDYVTDYYALAQGDQSLAGAGSQNMPIIQVRDDELWWQEGADANSNADQSEDSNAEDWYGNDYPEGEESTDSEHSDVCTDAQYSSDD